MLWKFVDFCYFGVLPVQISCQEAEHFAKRVWKPGFDEDKRAPGPGPLVQVLNNRILCFTSMVQDFNTTSNLSNSGYLLHAMYSLVEGLYSSGLCN